MRKSVFILFVIICVSPVIGQTVTESWLSLGFEYGNFWESATVNNTATKADMRSAGVNLTGYTFWNKKKMGLFVNDSFLFPLKGSATVNGNKIEGNFSDIYDFIMLIGLVTGPGFRFPISEKFIFRFGVGPSFFMLSGTADESRILGFNLGIGGDLGFKFDVSEVFFIDFGSKIGADFLSWSIINSPVGDTSGAADNYVMFRVQPYISIGLNYYTKEGFGKPE